MSTVEPQAWNSQMSKQYGLPCKVLRGTFPLERRFAIPLKGGEEFRNVAPFSAFYHGNGVPITEDEPKEADEKETLFIGVTIVGQKGEGKVLISVPNSGHFVVDRTILKQFDA